MRETASPTIVIIYELYFVFFFTAGAIIFTVIAILSIFSYYGFKSRIKLSALLLQVVMDISKHHTSVFLVALIALLIQAGLSVYVDLNF